LYGRAADVEGFFRPGWGDQKRMNLLQRFGVDYVFYGSAERRVGDYDPAQASFLQPVHQVGEVQIYRVIGHDRADWRATSDSRTAEGLR